MGGGGGGSAWVRHDRNHNYNYCPAACVSVLGGMLKRSHFFPGSVCCF